MADEHKQPDAEQKAKLPSIAKTRVRALARGYFGGSMIEPGEQFEINNDQELGAWMEPVNAADRERLAKRMEKMRGNRPPPAISKSVPPTPAVRIR